MRFWSAGAVLLLAANSVPSATSAEAMCPAPLADAAVPAHFASLARRQLTLEYGPTGLDIQKIQAFPVGRSLLRVEAQVQVRKTLPDNATTFWVTGWLNRCDGTLVLRGHAWLADGTLVAPRYTLEQLPGRGLVLGSPDAPLHVIAFVDSRCPHCHCLIAYARELLKKNALHIEFRQVAFLETAVEAIKDTRIHETALFVDDAGATGAEAYLDTLSEFNSTLEIDIGHPLYERGLALLQTNTQTAREVLRVSAVPAVLVLDRPKTREYRLVGLNEMNRLFQPDL